MFFLEHIPRDSSEGASDGYFQQVIARGRLTPTIEKLVEPLGKQRKDCQDRAALDHHIEQNGLMRQPMFCDQQMARGRDWQKFGDPLDDAEQNHCNPKWHAGQKRKKTTEHKRKGTTT